MDKNQIKPEYRDWIFSHSINNVTIIDEDGDIIIKTDYAVGKITFYNLEVTIVEMSVNNLADDENKFYLHFELKDIDHAKELFEEMLETLYNLKDQQKLRILLSCTGGLTTSFFSEKLNETAQVLSLDYEFNAVAFSK